MRTFHHVELRATLCIDEFSFHTLGVLERMDLVAVALYARTPVSFSTPATIRPKIRT